MYARPHLFELIKSLDHGEIKHFRKSATHYRDGKEPDYLRLFEAVLGQESYDEAALKRKFAGEGLEKNFASVKRFLYKRLLGFLASRERDADPRVRIESEMVEAEVLWKKGLYTQSARLYQRAADKARKVGLFELEVRALIRLVRDRTARGGKGTLEDLAKLQAEIRVAARRFRQWSELFQSNNSLFLLSRKYFGMPKPEALALADEVMQNPLLQGGVADIDFFEGQRFFLSSQARYADLNGDARVYAGLQKEIVALWEAHPDMLRFNRNTYRIDLANQLGASGVLMDFSDFPEALEKLHAIPAESRDEEGEVFQNTAFFELLYLMNSGQFEKAFDRLPAIESGLQQFSHKVNPARQLAFRYNMMVLYFVLEDYSAALRQLNLILHDDQSEHRQDIQQVARVFLLIFHFELGNLDLLEYLFRSAYRYFYTRNILGRFERAILGFLRKSSKLPPGPSLHPAFRELLAELQDILQDKSMRTPPGTEELIYWLRAKLDGRAMADVVRG